MKVNITEIEKELAQEDHDKFVKEFKYAYKNCVREQAHNERYRAQDEAKFTALRKVTTPEELERWRNTSHTSVEDDEE